MQRKKRTIRGRGNRRIISCPRCRATGGSARISVYHRTIRYGDLEAVEQLGQGREEKERLCQIANELAEQTTRGRVSAYWFLPLDGISYVGVGTDEAHEINHINLFNLSAAPCESPHRTVSYGTTVNLTRLREITQDLAALFGLTLPVSLKNSSPQIAPRTTK